MRPPSVFARPWLHEEAVRLKRCRGVPSMESTRERASVLLASNLFRSKLGPDGIGHKQQARGGHPRRRRAGSTGGRAGY